MAPPRRVDPAPYASDDVRTVTVGTVCFAVLFVVLLFFRADLAAHDASWWFAVPPIGVVLGLLGISSTRRRRDAIARDAAAGIPQRG